MPDLRLPLATYRIQFSLAFRFVDGRDLVPYLNDLGITDLYSSPRFKARRGSPHAYDVADPSKINSELGTEEEFQELAAKLRTYNMGLLLDIVPNHMATSSENPWWMDLLENGRASLYAAHFAVDWARESAKARRRARILLPILGDLYGNVLARGEVSLKLDENGFYAKYYEKRLPLDPKSYALILRPCMEKAREKGAAQAAAEIERLLPAIEALPATPRARDEVWSRHESKERLKSDLWAAYNGCAEFKMELDECLLTSSGIPDDPRSFDQLDRILDEQHYRIAYWRTAAEELNYRRFFDITDLVAIRVEDPEVFDARHGEILALTRTGDVTGLRVDHIDGLWDPSEYLERLRARVLDTAEGSTPPECAGFYVIVEKILGGDEQLPVDWKACGTTGYDYLNWLNGVFVEPAGLAKLDSFYRRFTGIQETMGEMRYRRKKQVVESLFPGELRALGYHLGRLAAIDRVARDLPFADLTNALLEVIAAFPIYRTYIRTFEVSPRDRHYIEQALAAAQKALPETSPEVFAFLRRVLLLEIPHYVEHPEEWLGFVQGWQQFTGPCMAKGFEDTTCYNYYRLLSQNEVGSDPETADHPVGVVEFHKRNRERQQRWVSLNATSTHDTKRSEDVRARINVISEIPEAWAERVEGWARTNEHYKTAVNGSAAPDRNDEYMYYQTLVGACPFCGEDMAAFRDRLRNFAQKATREAKTHSDWLNPNAGYEEAFLRFIDATLTKESEFFRDFSEFQKDIAPAGAVNGLAQVLLKICSPGVPDFYQGSEMWDFSLVDPDNRRPVDFQMRGAALDEIRRQEAHDLGSLIAGLVENWQDGRIKLYVTYKALNFRRAHRDLFLGGDYIGFHDPLHACAFVRHRGEEWALVAVPRFAYRPGGGLVNPGAWGEEALTLPEGAPTRWRNVFTGEDTASLRLRDLFGRFPVALLEPVAV